MDALLAQVKSLAGSADDAGRAKIQDALREAQYSLETPWDTMLRIFGLVSYLCFRYSIKQASSIYFCEEYPPFNARLHSTFKLRVLGSASISACSMLWSTARVP